MKVVITGHTKNLGKAFCNHFDTPGNSIIGLSRSTGYDLETKDGFTQALTFINQYKPDLFINNFYYRDTQAEFMKNLYNTVTTITVGSTCFDLENYVGLYAKFNKVIEDVHRNQNRVSDLQHLYLRLGRLENRPKPYMLYQEREEVTLISYDQVMQAVDCWIAHPYFSLIEIEGTPEHFIPTW